MKKHAYGWGCWAAVLLAGVPMARAQGSDVLSSLGRVLTESNAENNASDAVSRDDRVIRAVFREELRREPSAQELQDYRWRMAHQQWTADDVRTDVRSFRQQDRTDAARDRDRDYRDRDRDYRDREDARRPDRDEPRENRKGDTHAAAERIVRRAYLDFLGREPDREGMRNFVSNLLDDGWSEDRVREAIRRSPESAERIIRLAYRELLGRKPDAEGLALYTRRIVKDGWSEKRLREELRKSREFKEKKGRR